MSARVQTDERRRFARPPRRTRRGGDSTSECREHPGATLEDVVISTMAELEVAGRASCPVCTALALEPAGCGTCGSELS